MNKKVDIIVSCYNEEDNILAFFDEAKKYLNEKKYIYNLVFVNDGSSDKTYEKIISLQDKVKDIRRRECKKEKRLKATSSEE